ncbi:hypothetical protein AKJ41_03935 [candidate division MSBL1 archaeon SCGC-AAA259O05]|uniref:Uncharacterized protein n=1 Tax=candidate division MSBL1 archaeon SCGC-AAA259O05 TaxID=1698271 RepID=A0A133V295_9EURY|nr:hypothetical protein AKJ41_03935 [candidate division MSBL1 archaeon SCGC-AAA259O05]
MSCPFLPTNRIATQANQLFNLFPILPKWVRTPYLGSGISPPEQIKVEITHFLDELDLNGLWNVQLRYFLLNLLEQSFRLNTPLNSEIEELFPRLLKLPVKS